MQRLVERWGYQVEVVSDGIAAYEYLTKTSRGVIALVDWMMPGMEGPAICSALLNAGFTQHYMILVTSRNAVTDQARGRDAGAHDFLVKPFETLELHSRLRVGLRTLRIQEEMAMREEQLGELLSALPLPVCFKDSAGRWLEANPACLALFNFPDGDYVGRTAQELREDARQADEVLAAMSAADSAALSAEEMHRSEVEYRTLTREERVLDLTTLPLYDSKGHAHAIIQMANDITAAKLVEKELREEATVDPLTGVFTRREFMRNLENALSLARRHSHPIAFCICDIDKFKMVNDTYGHQAGDAVLKRFTEILVSGLRDTDVVGRFGGDEFCAILPFSAEEGAILALDRIRQRFHNESFTAADGTTFHVSGSFGVAVYHAERDNAAEMTTERILELADEALYRCKEAGRNTVSA